MMLKLLQTVPVPITKEDLWRREQGEQFDLPQEEKKNDEKAREKEEETDGCDHSVTALKDTPSYIIESTHMIVSVSRLLQPLSNKCYSFILHLPLLIEYKGREWTKQMIAMKSC